MNEPIGRFGSCSPARARRTALATAWIASSWPMTRWCSRSSIWRSFWISPSSIFDDRDAGPLRDHFGDVFLVDFLLEHALVLLQLARASLRLFELPSAARGSVPYCSSAALFEIALPLRLLDLDAESARSPP